MATAHLKGDASFKFTPPAGVETTHLLAVPLSPLPDFRPQTTQQIHRWWSADRTTDESVAVGAEVAELVAAIRFDNEPDDLTTMLMHGLRGVELTYIPVQAGTEYPVKLVSVNGYEDKVDLQPDRDRGGFGEYECTIHIRRVDGGSLADLL